MGIVDQWRPETGAGGYARDDETIHFFTRIRSLIQPHMTVVDLGAGRGSRFDDPDSFHARFCDLRGDVECVVGFDPDPAVLHHPGLDRAQIVEPGARLPVEDSGADIVMCEYVVEHIEDPVAFAREIERVLKPGGWFCALTPNANGYVGLGNRVVPAKLKRRLMRWVWPERREDDAFETFYRLNTLRSVRTAFDDARWSHHSFAQGSTPKYHANRTVPFALVALAQALAPPAFQTNLHIFCRKTADPVIRVEPAPPLDAASSLEGKPSARLVA